MRKKLHLKYLNLNNYFISSIGIELTTAITLKHLCLCAYHDRSEIIRIQIDI